MRFIRLAALGATLTFASTGCVVSSSSVRAAAPCVLPLLCLASNPELVVGAALVTVALLHHDSHYHGYGCGCPTRIWHDQRVWWYGGHWEFRSHGRWYAVPDCPAPY